jgi:hypothetical protein
MKLAARILSVLVLASFASFYLSCDGGDDPEKSEKDEQIELLTGTWNATAVTLDGDTPALDYSTFALEVSGTAGSDEVSYQALNRPDGLSPWAPDGFLTFGDNVKQQLVREDGITVNYSVTETTLILDFTFEGDGYPGGRVREVQGNWHFEFQKAI